MDTILDLLLFLALCNLSPENGLLLKPWLLVVQYIRSLIQNRKPFHDVHLVPHTVLKYQTLVIPKLPISFLLRCSGSNSFLHLQSHMAIPRRTDPWFFHVFGPDWYCWVLSQPSWAHPTASTSRDRRTRITDLPVHCYSIIF